MDLSFFQRRAQGFDKPLGAQLDYGVLVATLGGMQSASAAARALRSFGPETGMAPGRYPIVDILLGGPFWAEALAAQGGCFNRAAAMQAGKGA